LITNVLDKYLDSMIPKDNVKEGYLCGSPGMISGCIQVFNKYSIKDVYFDKF
jgi:Na+-transporting NADH:ubiquinone oxidoreductase subunit F